MPLIQFDLVESNPLMLAEHLLVKRPLPHLLLEWPYFEGINYVFVRDF
jgi:hypothetical protein